MFVAALVPTSKSYDDKNGVIPLPFHYFQQETDKPTFILVRGTTAGLTIAQNACIILGHRERQV